MMSPDRFVALESIPGHAGFALADDLMILWSSSLCAEILGAPGPELAGLRLGDVLQRSIHADRIAELCRRVAVDGAVTLQDFWRGRRLLIRVWPLDPRAFARPGAFILLVRGPVGFAEHPALDFSPFSPDFGDLAVLTARELEVLRMLADGMSDKGIATELHRTKSTVETHVASILRKLKIDNRSAATRIACERGITAFTPEQWRAVLARGIAPPQGRAFQR